MKNLKALKAQASKLPKLPGVYQYQDQFGKIIYIGKAKNLYRRVNSYFKQEHDLKTNLLVNQINKIEYLITPTEIDALTLEDQLIREHQPKYNILLKSDSSYRYICLTRTNPPQIKTSRSVIKNQYCLGPFPFATHEIVKIARDILGLTKHQNLNFLNWQIYLDAANFYQNKSKQTLDEQTYREFINKLVRTIKHGDQNLIINYQTQMAQHAKKLEFEQALAYKHKIDLLNKFTQRTSQISPTKNKSEHLLIYTSDHNQILIYLFNIQNGLLHSLQDFKFNQDYSDEILNTFLKQYYNQHEPPAKISIYIDTPKINKKPNHDLLINDYLNLIWQIKPDIQIITKHKLLDLALKNISAKQNHKNNLNQELKYLFNLKQLPQVVDFVDISNLSDQIVVGGVIRFINGEPAKNMWRHYKIKAVTGQDDYASISETILRRYQKISPPDILIVDGGLGQLNAAQKSLPNNSKIYVAGLAKAYETLIFQNHTSLRLSLKNRVDQFIIRGRDQVHNFVISYTRKVFNKNYKESSLDQIKGIGPSTKLKLLKYFKSIDQIKKANLDELSQIIGQHKAQLILDAKIATRSRK